MKAPEINVSPRILMGPGPSMADPRVLKAMATPLVGHLDPEFLAIMDTTQKLLRYVFETENPLTIPVSGTGSASMEAAVCNMIEPGDTMLVCCKGDFGLRVKGSQTPDRQQLQSSPTQRPSELLFAGCSHQKASNQSTSSPTIIQTTT